MFCECIYVLFQFTFNKIANNFSKVFEEFLTIIWRKFPVEFMEAAKFAKIDTNSCSNA